MAEEVVDIARTEQASSSSLSEHRKELIADVEVSKDIQDSPLFLRKRMERVFAVRRRFTRVSFMQSAIRECYFRNCEFVECNFTGAHFIGSNFQGAKFEGCDFSYATFEKTDVGLDILTHNLPPHENLKRDLARTLRTNYGSVGNYDGVNAAILVELNATLEHYRKAAFSAESHYRRKHKGIERLTYAWKFVSFWILDKFWGNGERPWRLVWAALGTWLLGAAYGVGGVGLPVQAAASASASAFVLGNSSALGSFPTILLALARYLILGMFLATLVKRLARR